MTTSKIILLGDVLFKTNNKLVLNIKEGHKALCIPVLCKLDILDHILLKDVLYVESSMETINDRHYFVAKKIYIVETNHRFSHVRMIGRLMSETKIKVDDKEYQIKMPEGFPVTIDSEVEMVGGIECLGEKAYAPYIKVITTRVQ